MDDNPRSYALWVSRHFVQTGRIRVHKPNIQEIPKGPMPPALVRLILMKMDVPR